MPTLIFPGLSLGSTLSSSTAHEVWAIFPSAGKHVRFEGSLWHGVPPAAVFAPGATAARRVGRPGARRVTLLVNVWLDRVPAHAYLPKSGMTEYDAVAVPPLHFTESQNSLLIERWAQRPHPRSSLWIRTVSATALTASSSVLDAGADAGGGGVGDVEFSTTTVCGQRSVPVRLQTLAATDACPSWHERRRQ